jgi:hypothetical protein
LSSGYSGGWYWVSMNKWVEPDGGYASSSCHGYNGYTDPRSWHSQSWYANLCGPGSSEAIISNWNNNPNTYSGYYYYGYVASQGLHWLGYFFTIANEEMAYSTCPENSGQAPTWGTCVQTGANVINHEIGTPYYEVDWCAGSIPDYNCSNPSYSNWQHDVSFDMESAGVPLVDEVMTCSSGGQCLPGWPYRADHFQAISQYDPTDQLDKYGETGNAVDTCGSGYQAPAPGVYTNSKWQDPVTGAYFNEQSGWDYVSNQFHWQRSLRVVW